MNKIFTLILTVLCVTVLFAQSPEKFSYQAVVRNASNSLVANAPVGVRVSILQGSATGNAVYVETQTVTTNANGLLTLEIGGGNVQQGTFADIEWANGPYFLKTETDPNGGTNYSITSTQQMLSVPYALYAKDAGNGFSGDYNDLTNRPQIPQIPANVSAFNNDAGYITNYTETDPQYNAWNKDYNDLINKPTIPTVPSNVSAFANDAGYLTSYTESDPTIPAWAKEATKPAYDYSEIANTPVIPTVPTNISAFVNDVPYLTSFTEQQVLTISNDTIFLTGGSFVKLPEGFSGDYNDLTNKPEIPETPTVPDSVSAFTNDAGYITMADLQALLDELNNRIDSLNDRIEELESDTTTAPVTPVYQDGQPCPEAPTVSDVDNNTYNTVQIGNQCWMKENLRTLHYADNSEVVGYKMPTISNASDEYGYLYTKSAVMNGEANSITAPSGVQGICPDGWHVPSDAEWVRFREYVSSQNEYVCGNSPDNIAKALANVSGWGQNNSSNACLMNYSPWTNNSTGFSALPTENMYGDLVTIFHSASSVYQMLAVYSSTLSVYQYATYAAVRCVRGDASDTSEVFTPTGPVLITDTATIISTNSATVSGRLVSNGGVSIRNCGLVCGTTPNPSIVVIDDEDDFYSYWSGNGNYIGERSSFSLDLTNLRYHTTYYVRAYAYNTLTGEYVYGNEVSFTTGYYENACPEMKEVIDVDGNDYPTIQIGSQCWMKENLRAHHYANGDSISDVRPDPSSYDLIYFGDDVRRTRTITQTDFTQGLQGVCPEGWHLPTIVEWNEFMNYINSAGDVSGFGECRTYWTSIGNYDFNTCDGTYNTLSYSHIIDNFRNYARPVRCVRGVGLTLPIVRLDSVSDITTNNAHYSAEVVSNGGMDVLDRGIYWSTTPTLPTSDLTSLPNHISRTAGLNNVGTFSGTFPKNNTNLTAGTTYYVWAYATSYIGTSYSEMVSFTTQTEPASPAVTLATVHTGVMYDYSEYATVRNITDTSATSGCVIKDNGGASITEQGICWSTSPNPTLQDSHVAGSDTLTGLNPCTTYYVRAYAVNSVGVAYGNELSFTTLCNNPMMSDAQPCPGASTLTDIDGNTYNTVKIGQQCWMKENLRSTRYANGDAIEGITPSELGSLSSVGYQYPVSSVLMDGNVSTTSSANVQSVCPDGWHLPTFAEWKQLFDYVGGQSSYVCGELFLSSNNNIPILFNDTYYGIASALCLGNSWSQFNFDTCTSNHVNNATGFSASPTMSYLPRDYSSGVAYASVVGFVQMNQYGTVYMYHNTFNTDRFSVRCVRGAGVNPPKVNTIGVGLVKDTTAMCSGQIISNGGASITESGICISSKHVPTVSDYRVNMGVYDGSFGALVENLTPGTTYYIRAYATNAVGTGYGDMVSFTTTVNGAPSNTSCPGVPYVSDFEGNYYSTVQIGNQCWLKENLRSLYYYDGTLISYYGNGNTVTVAAPDDDESLVEQYGYLYNWNVVMHDASSSTATPSGVQGICPNGWHVPSTAEWQGLFDYLSSHSEYLCGEGSNNIAKALASNTGWYSSWNECAVGYNQSQNNASGFNAIPVGGCLEFGNYDGMASWTGFWTSTSNSSSYSASSEPFSCMINYNSSAGFLTWYSGIKLSVRCLRD